MDEKTCMKCGISKPLTEFYMRKTGPNRYYASCKKCCRLHAQAIYDPEKQKVYRAKKMTRGMEIEVNRRQREKYPEKYSARRKAREAVKQGLIEKKSCEVCSDTKVDGHHDDYSKPLEVRWLCRIHHMMIHRKDAIIEPDSSN